MHETPAKLLRPTVMAGFTEVIRGIWWGVACVQAFRELVPRTNNVGEVRDPSDALGNSDPSA